MTNPHRSVTITADDLGLDPAVNAAIADLARAGRLHAASMLIDAPHAGAAITPQLPIAVGLHLALSEDFLGAATSPQIHAEMTRQWRQMSAAGRTPAHLDLHTLALYGIGPGSVRPGGVLPEAVAVAAEHEVPLRLPRMLPADFDVDHATRSGHRDLVDAAEMAGVALPQTILSDFRPPHLTTSYADLRDHYRDLIASLPTGRSEIFLHPALPQATADDDARGRPHDLAFRKRGWEYHLLASGDLHRDLADAGVAARHRREWHLSAETGG